MFAKTVALCACVACATAFVAPMTGRASSSSTMQMTTQDRHAFLSTAAAGLVAFGAAGVANAGFIADQAGSVLDAAGLKDKASEVASAVSPLKDQAGSVLDATGLKDKAGSLADKAGSAIDGGSLKDKAGSIASKAGSVIDDAGLKDKAGSVASKAASVIDGAALVDEKGNETQLPAKLAGSGPGLQQGKALSSAEKAETQDLTRKAEKEIEKKNQRGPRAGNPKVDKKMTTDKQVTPMTDRPLTL